MPVADDQGWSNYNQQNMNTLTVQPHTQTSSDSSASQIRPSQVNFFVVAFCCVAFAMLAYFTGRGPDGSFEPMALKDKLDAMPRWAHGALTGALLVLLAVAFDCIGRLLAFPIARIAFGRAVTRRRLASIRMVVLAAILALVAVGMILGVCPTLFGWARPAFFGVLLAPIALSVVEWIRSKS